MHIQVVSILVDAFEQKIQEDPKAPIGPALTRERSGRWNRGRFRHRERTPFKNNEERGRVQMYRPTPGGPLIWGLVATWDKSATGATGPQRCRYTEPHGPEWQAGESPRTEAVPP